MSERLRSVGLDVGTTSTQMILSELRIENRASSFAVPEMEIAERTILYKSPVHFTPLLGENQVDGAAIRELIGSEYRKAGIDRGSVDTGAIIITGETSRKENARAVLEALSDFAGEFVVAAAGPELESVLAAKGAGAVEYSLATGKTLLHMDIGGGTSNLALIREGKIQKTACLNVGGRLVKFDPSGVVTYVSSELTGLWDFRPGDHPADTEVAALAETLTQALEMAAGLREQTPLLAKLWTRELAAPPQPLVSAAGEELVLSFSGGVADCIGREYPRLTFGDMGPVLGQAIRRSRLCGGEYRLGQETIRATVIGAGCHSTQLSGSTVFHQNIRFPLKNIPVARLDALSQLEQLLPSQDGPVVLAMAGIAAPSYRQVAQLAQAIASRVPPPLYLCLEQDMAKALGQALAVRLPPGTPLLCIDRVKVSGESYLDVGAPVGHAIPVVVKTLVLH